MSYMFLKDVIIITGLLQVLRKHFYILSKKKTSDFSDFTQAHDMSIKKTSLNK